MRPYIINMRNIRLTIQYDGTDFSGYEIQPDKKSVRGEIEKALSALFKKEISINAVSRTDSKVHAIAQIVQFQIDHPIEFSKIPKVLNTYLPDDIRAVDSKEIKNSENVRYFVKNKEYQYLIYNGTKFSPFFRNYVWHVKQKLDIKAMKSAAKFFKGKHDFSSFCAARSFLAQRIAKKLGKPQEHNFLRTIYKVTIKNKKINLWDGCALDVIAITFKGDGFLYKMVRNMVGTLVDVGLKKKKPFEIKEIISKKQRKFAGRCAPPQGLCLIKVNFK